MTISEPLLINDKQATFKTWTNRRFCVKIDFDYDVDAALPNVKISIIRKSDGQEFFPKVVKDSAPELLYYIDYDVKIFYLYDLKMLQ
jgi:hypothetical protein